MNEEGHLILRLAVGLYLAYLAYMLISAQMAGDTGMSDVVAYVGGGILGLGGWASVTTPWCATLRSARLDRKRKTYRRRRSREPSLLSGDGRAGSAAAPWPCGSPTWA